MSSTEVSSQTQVSKVKTHDLLAYHANKKAPVFVNRGLVLIILIVAEVEIAAIACTPALLFGTITVRTFRLSGSAISSTVALWLTAGTTVALVV